MSVPLSQTVKVSETMTFSHTAGASVTVGTTFEVGVPLVTSAEISAEISASYEFSSGTKSNFFFKLFKTAFEHSELCPYTQITPNKVSTIYGMAYITN